MTYYTTADGVDVYYEETAMDDPTDDMETVEDVVKGAEFMKDAEENFIYMVDLVANVPSIEDAYENKKLEQGFVTVNDIMLIHGCPCYSTTFGNTRVDNPMFRDYPGASDVVEVAYEMLKSME